MISTRNFTNFFFVAALAASAGFAFSATDAEAGGKEHKPGDDYNCATSPNKAKLGAAYEGYKAACEAAGVKTYRDVAKLMKDWKKKAKGKKLDGSFEVKNCKSCHEDPKGLKGTKAEGYKHLKAYMAAGK